MSKAEILVVEDEGIVARDIAGTLEKLGYAVAGVTATGEAALEKVSQSWPDLVLMDVVLKGPIDGVETARQVRDKFDIPVIYLTAHADDDTLQRAKVTHPFGYLVKPFDERDLHTAVELAIHKHQMERRLRESEQHFRSLIENATDLITILDCDGIIRYASPSHSPILGYNPEELIGRDAFELVHPDDLAHVKNAFQQVLTTQILLSAEYRCRHKNGSWRFIESKGSNRLADPVIAGIVVNSRDFTERHHAEEAKRMAQEKLLEHQQRQRQIVEAELAKASEQLVRQTRLAAMGQMAASITHELRNPLAVVKNATYCLKHQVAAGRAESGEHFLLIERGIDTIKRIINNLLEMAHAKESRRQTIDLGAMVQDVFHRLASFEPVQCHLELQPDPFLVSADQVQLQLVLENLIVNAMQAMKNKGSIWVAARREQSRDVITVRDNGPGIPETVRERVFEPLVTSKPQGTGLGLPICRQIIEQHGGTIEVLSTERNGTESHGTTVRICLPRRKTSLGSAKAPEMTKADCS